MIGRLRRRGARPRSRALIVLETVIAAYPPKPATRPLPMLPATFVYAQHGDQP